MNEDVQFKWVGHAMVQMHYEGKTLLTDPWFTNHLNFEGLWAFPPLTRFTAEQLKAIDYIHISHAHPDHLCAESLQPFDKGTPIYIGQYKNKFLFRFIQKLGFKNIIEMKEGQLVQAGPFTLISILSEPQNSNFDSALIVKAATQTVYLNNDCILTQETYELLNQKYGPIHGGFLGYSGVSPYPTCYSFENKQASLSHSPNDYTQLAKNFYLDHFKQVYRTLQFKWVVPYANDLRCMKPETLKSNATFSIPADLANQNLNIVELKQQEILNLTDLSIKPSSSSAVKFKDLNDYSKTLKFHQYHHPKTLVSKVDQYIIETLLQNQKRAKNDFTVLIQYLQDEAAVGQLSVQFHNKNFDFTKELAMDRYDMIVKYPFDLLVECVEGRGFIANIHYGFQYKVIVRSLVHDFFETIAGNSPGAVLGDG